MAHQASAGQLAQVPLGFHPRPHYGRDQLQKYFERIRLPQQHCATPILDDPQLAGTKGHGLPLLAALHRYHLANIRFENLELHYSAHRKISLNMDDLFDKFAVRGGKYGRGGHCMENNGLFGTVLRSLGYEVRNCAGRVSRSWSPDAETRTQQCETYDNWNHVLNLVKVDGQWWVVDVGMGSMGPAVIYPLEDGFESIAVPPRRIRLQKRSIPETYAHNKDQAPKLWCYDQCLAPDKPGKDSWIPTYCFTETEFLPQDYEMMSWYTSTNPKSFFTYSILCTKLLLSEDESHIIGDVTLFNDGYRKTVAGQRDTPVQLKTEQERLDAMKEVFGLEFTEEEKNGISAEKRLA
ncbi:Arylamine N-acetyltransferase [Fulvia fulva]|uniref:Arylamine N-acetyltransferase n=1 Tax=Passalora fulva TaxID=5499 RepID=A0A9Q8LGT9_PASFU|nr:Arylamine N-acetyltransferase [Fulvia fulva]KAK4623754.1 Arylamine N-acetyltransferase [Fulvia fulva]KAK4626029.1 Arylamine N-acetyltransferase [Fulvia fulva]UJO17179.1 Arylamine N-acetyltransferase [Fulvia fulva]WPV15425.1 Arylamine N-acetyltransferase [Fulvia fulva]WPV29996.1 Arylamine N-acetyltransferase [Fulvia fulva]